MMENLVLYFGGVGEGFEIEFRNVEKFRSDGGFEGNRGFRS